MPGRRVIDVWTAMSTTTRAPHHFQLAAMAGVSRQAAYKRLSHQPQTATP